jgi:hypothetical protein
VRTKHSVIGQVGELLPVGPASPRLKVVYRHLPKLGSAPASNSLLYLNHLKIPEVCLGFHCYGRDDHQYIR